MASPFAFVWFFVLNSVVVFFFTVFRTLYLFAFAWFFVLVKVAVFFFAVFRSALHCVRVFDVS